MKVKGRPAPSKFPPRQFAHTFREGSSLPSRWLGRGSLEDEKLAGTRSLEGYVQQDTPPSKRFSYNHASDAIAQGRKGGTGQVCSETKGRFAKWRPAQSHVATHLERKTPLTSVREKRIPPPYPLSHNGTHRVHSAQGLRYCRVKALPNQPT